LIGAIIGDVIGSVFERHNTKTTDFALFSRFTTFTDDTVLTVAVADAILKRAANSEAYTRSSERRRLYANKIKEYGRRYPDVGYGKMFRDWVKSDSMKGYGSYGNGSAMRVSPIGFAFDTLDDVLKEAEWSAVVTHNHRQAVKGAQAIAAAIFLARTGESKEGIKAFLTKKFKYNLDQWLDDIRPEYKFDVSCDGSVPQAIIAFMESKDFEDAVRKAISLGGDSDTIASMAGGIAQAYYKEVPKQLIDRVWLLLDSSLRDVIREFEERYELSY
jgi:ADP-ribosylglycohydrolase